MQITWHGLSCFHIASKPIHDQVNVVIDPYQNSVGLRFPRTLKADITAVSIDKPEHNNLAAIGDKPYTVTNPGEYEVKGVFIYGIDAPKADEKEKKSHQIFRIETEDVTLVHLGALDQKLNEEELAQLQRVDVLMIPIGGGSVMTAKTAVDVIGQIDPRIVIPMYYSLPKIKEKLATVDSFCKEVGVCQREESSKLKISKKDLPQEDRLVAVLNRS